MSTTIDYNVDNYTISELLAILDLEDDATNKEITDTSNAYIDRYQKENSPTLVTFFQDIQTKLLQYNEETTK